MDKGKDIVKDFFKGKLQDYEPPVKRDLWSSLERHIPAEKSLWRRIYPAVASAAAVLLIFMLSYKYLFNESPDSSETIVSVIENIPVEVEHEEVLTEDKLQANVNPRVARVELPEKRDVINNAEPDSEGEEKKEPSVSESETKQEHSAEETDENTAYPPRDEDRRDNLGYDNNRYAQVITKKNTGSKMQISFSGNGFPAMSNDLDYFKIYNTDYLSSYENNFQMDELFLVKSDGTTGGHGPEDDSHSWFPADNYRLKNIKYGTPVTLSLHISRNISPRWAIETGVSYTKLSSEETWEAEVDYYYYNNTDMLTNKIKLDYLGIPLRASYYPIKKDRFYVYVSAGGMIEKCISGKAFTAAERAKKEESTNLKISELQYSVTGGVGIGLRLFKPVSLFVEPGVIYYFDDGSDIMTIRKDKPFNYNIQGGLRFSF